MKIPDDDTSRMLEDECPGSPDLESALANESVGSAASHPALLVDASTSLGRVLQLMRESNRDAVLVVSSGMLVGILTERDVLMKVAGQPTDLLTALLLPSGHSFSGLSASLTPVCSMVRNPTRSTESFAQL